MDHNLFENTCAHGIAQLPRHIVQRAFTDGRQQNPGNARFNGAAVSQIACNRFGTLEIQRVANGIDDLHQKRFAVGPHPRDPNITVAAAAAFHNVAMLRRKSGGHHIVNMAGHTIETLRQIAALQFHHAAVRLIQCILDKASNQI